MIPAVLAFEYGLLGALVVANIVLGILLRDNRQYVLAAFLFFALIGFDLRYGVSTSRIGLPLPIGMDAFGPPITGLAIAAGLQLCRVMFDTKDGAPGIDGLLFILMMISVAVGLLSWIPDLGGITFGRLINEAVLPAVMLLSLATILGVSAIRSNEVAGVRRAGMMGWALMLLGLPISELGQHGVLAESWAWNFYAPILLISGALLTISNARVAYRRVLSEEITQHIRNQNIQVQDNSRPGIKRERALEAELQKRLEERNHAMRRAKEAADEASKAKTAFIAFLSHEIRTPLNGILGTARLLAQSKEQMNSSQQDYVQALNYSGETLLAIVNDVLDLSKIEAGEMEMDKVDIDLRKLLHSIVIVMGAKGEERGLYIRQDVDAILPAVVRGDMTRMRQILLNLVNNALKFTRTGGVTIRARAVENERSATLPENHVLVRFEIQDTGIGIPQEAKNRLFREYQQADAMTSRLYGGTGLGLHICKQLVEAMGGKIDFDSEINKGSIFWFDLVLEKGDTRLAKIEKEEKAAEETSLDMPAMVILVVEDDPINQMVIEGYLKPFGHEVLKAEDGESAIKAASEQDFDAILMDVNLGDMSGLDVTREIRKFEIIRRREVPIIAITGSVSLQDIDMCRAAGMNDFVGKPIDPGRLAAALRRAKAQLEKQFNPDYVDEDNLEITEVEVESVANISDNTGLPEGELSQDLTVKELIGPKKSSSSKGLDKSKAQSLAEKIEALMQTPMQRYMQEHEDGGTEVNMVRDGFGNLINPSQLEGMKQDERYRIMIIEDDPISQQIVQKYLKDLGHQTMVHGDAESGLNTLRDEQVDVILMDVDLPGMNGIDATRSIRSEFDLPKQSTPVIAITGNISEEDVEACRAAGMNDFIGKPVNPVYLDGAIRRVIHMRIDELAAIEINFDEETVLKLLDTETLNHLQRAFAKEQFDSLIESFMDRSHNIIDTLIEASQTNDLEILKAQSHLLKGMAANVGMAELRRIALNIETSIKEDDTGHLVDLVQNLTPVLEQSKAALDYVQSQEF